jgi:hypothetical protein
MKNFVLSLTAAAMLATAVPLAGAQAAPAGDQATVQAAGMTDVTSRHRHFWRHHYWRHRHVFWHRPYYRHYGWYRHHRYYRHYGLYRGW